MNKSGENGLKFARKRRFDVFDVKLLSEIFHVHDEVVIDIRPFADDKAMLDTIIKIISAPIPWASGMPLGADGWVGKFFKKD